jgi:hypothetical protein
VHSQSVVPILRPISSPFYSSASAIIESLSPRRQFRVVAAEVGAYPGKSNVVVTSLNCPKQNKSTQRLPLVRSKLDPLNLPFF